MTTAAHMDLTANAVRRPGLWVFSTLFFMEAMARATMATIVPLQAYALLGEARFVSYLSFTLALGGLLAGLSVPMLIRHISRRWTYTLGACSMLAAAAVLAGQTVPGQVAGMALRNFGAICLNISLMLYIMDYVRKHELVRNDSRRIAVAMLGWTIGPFLGVWLYEHVGPFAAFGWSAAWSGLLIVAFWLFRMSDGGAIIAAKTPPANPLEFVPRFVTQPRLMLAWMIAFGRSGFWGTLFVYGPILMEKTGVTFDVAGLHVGSGDVAGILISASQVLLLSALLWGRMAARLGLRATIAFCFAGMSVSLLATGLAGEAAPLLAGAGLLATAFFCTGLDAVGGVAFYRAVRMRERAPMTAVYRTYLEIGDLIPNLVYGIILIWLPLGAVFAADGLACVGFALVCWKYLPRRL